MNKEKPFNPKDHLDKPEIDFIERFLANHFLQVCRLIYSDAEILSWDEAKKKAITNLLVKNHLEYQEGFKTGFVIAKNYYLNPQRN